jgi:hypothetical protein
MKIRQKTIVAFVMLLLATAMGVQISPSAEGQTIDNRIYAELLNKYVKKGKVDYAGFKSEEPRLNEYLKQFEGVNPQSLSRSEQFAFYINAYNAWTIKLILSGYPGVNSIKDLGSVFKSPWEKKIVRINGEVVTLDDVEHNILRPRFADPRVHFAINCAAKSCPPLRSEPYSGMGLDEQLDDSARRFLNNPANYRLQGNEFYVSRIFKWFAEDFNDDVVGFYLEYATGELKKKLEAKSGDIDIKFLSYDWSLNGK